MVKIPDEDIRIIEFGKEDAVDISQLFKEVWPGAKEYPEEWQKKRIYSPEQIIEDMDRKKVYMSYQICIMRSGTYGGQNHEKTFAG